MDTLTLLLFCVLELGEGIITTVLRIQDRILYKLNKDLLIRGINAHRLLPMLPDISGYTLKAGSIMRDLCYVCGPGNPAVFTPFQLRLVEEVLGFLNTLPLIS